jgi:hypothetical protein
MRARETSSKISRVDLGRRQGTRGKLVNSKRHLLKELREHSEPKGELMYTNVPVSILFRPVGKYPVNSRRDQSGVRHEIGKGKKRMGRGIINILWVAA